MPLYHLLCDCGQRFDFVSSMARRSEIVCPGCGAANVGTDWQRTGAPRMGNNEWDDARGRSHEFIFQRDGVESIKNDCPSMELVPHSHNPNWVQARFRSNANHRQVLREVNAAEARHKAEAANRPNKEPAHAPAHAR